MLIDGASGAVGTMAVQWARSVGASVVAITSSKEGAEHCARLGAERVLMRTSGTFDEDLASIARIGVDVWWDLSRNPALERAVALLRAGGQLIVASGRAASATLEVGKFYGKGLTMVGILVYHMKSAQFTACTQATTAAWTEGRLLPSKFTFVPWTEIGVAHVHMEMGKGRYVLTGFGGG